MRLRNCFSSTGQNLSRFDDCKMAQLGILLAPIVIPVTIIGAAGGLFYGSYDLTLSSLGLLVGTKPPNECSRWERSSTFAAGLGLSTVVLYGRSIISTPPTMPTIDLSDQQALLRFRNSSKHIIQFFPYKWLAMSTMIAGGVTGATVALTRRR